MLGFETCKITKNEYYLCVILIIFEPFLSESPTTPRGYCPNLPQSISVLTDSTFWFDWIVNLRNTYFSDIQRVSCGFMHITRAGHLSWWKFTILRLVLCIYHHRLHFRSTVFEHCFKDPYSRIIVTQGCCLLLKTTFYDHKIKQIKLIRKILVLWLVDGHLI